MTTLADLAAMVRSDPIKGAWLSSDRRYRYALWRSWQPAARTLAVCMLNPSTADASKDDPTIRRLVSFGKAWGYGGITVVNLFAYRTAYPAELHGRSYDVIVGPENNAAMEAVIQAGQPVLVGWGAAAWAGLAGEKTRRNDVLRYAAHVGALPMCLGITAGGEPRHPLYVRAEQGLSPYA